MTGAHRPIVVLLTLAVVALIAVAFILATVHAFGLFGSLDARLAAILLTALAVAIVLALGLRAGAADGERRERWQRRLDCYRRLLEGLDGSGRDAVPMTPDLALLAGPGVVKTLARVRQLAPGDPARPAAMAALVRELRRDLGSSSGVLSENELLRLLPALIGDVGANP